MKCLADRLLFEIDLWWDTIRLWWAKLTAIDFISLDELLEEYERMWWDEN